jgi:hypothetical protein
MTPVSDGPIPFARRDARDGIVWLKRACAMFLAAPMKWLLLLLTYYVLMGLLEIVPLQPLGELLAPLLKPVFAVGFLAAAWSQERGIPPRFADLFRGFRSNLLALVPLGAVLLAGMLLAVFATRLIDGGMLLAIMSGAEKPTDEMLASGTVQLAMLFGVACAVPTLLALWFAPALVVFHDASALRAMVTSFRAAIANWRPIAVYCLAVFVSAGAVPVLALKVAELFGDTLPGLVAVLVVAPYLFALAATLQIADYISYRDVFHADEPLPQSRPATTPDT